MVGGCGLLLYGVGRLGWLGCLLVFVVGVCVGNLVCFWVCIWICFDWLCWYLVIVLNWLAFCAFLGFWWVVCLVFGGFGCLFLVFDLCLPWRCLPVVGSVVGVSLVSIDLRLC